MHVLIVGPGGVGGYIGDILAAGGTPVTFMASNARARVLQTSGLRVRTVDRELHVVPAEIASDTTQFGDFDVVVLCVKYFDLTDVARTLKGRLSEECVVLTVQNGIDADVLVREILEHPYVFPGTAHIISSVDPVTGAVVQTGGPCYFVFGARDGVPPEVLTRAVHRLGAAGLDAHLAEQIESELWFKYLFVLPYSGLTAAFARSFQEVYATTGGRRMFKAMLEESLQVARYEGVRLSVGVGNSVFERAQMHMCEQRPATSSLQRDLAAGKPTELDGLHGTLLRLAGLHRVPVPVTQALYNRIAMRQSGA
jgi:2-dehydropantoate 2-reductase